MTQPGSRYMLFDGTRGWSVRVLWERASAVNRNGDALFFYFWQFNLMVRRKSGAVKRSPSSLRGSASLRQLFAIEQCKGLFWSFDCMDLTVGLGSVVLFAQQTPSLRKPIPNQQLSAPVGPYCADWDITWHVCAIYHTYTCTYNYKYKYKLNIII